MAKDENSKFNKIKNNLGLVILAAAFIASCITVFYNQMTHKRPDTKAIRICHWQLEAGFRGALDEIIKDYETQYLERTGKKVKIIQVPVAERGYAQFINTGLIGNMAPDIIEMGQSTTLSNFSNIVRYFAPLGDFLREPNPYNEGTPLAGLPWKDTFFDNLQGSIRQELQEYFVIPFSMFTMRLYYNKKLLKEISGSDKFPTKYGDFIELCKKVNEYNRRTGKNVVAVAACQNQLNFFEGKFKVSFLNNLIQQNDLNLNGSLEEEESFHAYRSGKWNFKSPELVNSWKCLREISENFMPGWIAAKRDDAAFAFVQGRALMTVTGSWDAKSMVDQAKGNFDVGISDFPYPTDHPEFSKYVKGGVNEASIRGGIPWGVNKRSKHFDICIDFLRYATTRKVNEKFNEMVYWIPVVKGAEIKHEILKEFAPKLDGYSGSIKYDISTQFSILSRGEKWMLFSGKISADEYADRLTDVYEKSMVEGFGLKVEKSYRILRTYDRVMSAYLLLNEIGTKKQQSDVRNRIPALADIITQQAYVYFSNRRRFDQFKPVVPAAKKEDVK